MTAYINITDTETDPEAPLTSELAKKWRDNPLAIIEGDATAIAAGKQISRNALKSSLNSVSGSVPSGSQTSVTFDAWSFSPDIRAANTLTVQSRTGTANGDTPGFLLSNGTGAAISYTIAWRRLLA